MYFNDSLDLIVDSSEINSNVSVEYSVLKKLSILGEITTGELNNYFKGMEIEKFNELLEDSYIDTKFSKSMIVYETEKVYSLSKKGETFIFKTENNESIINYRAKLASIGVPDFIFDMFLEHRNTKLSIFTIFDLDKLYEFVMDSYYPDKGDENPRHEMIHSLIMAMRQK